MQTGFMCFRCSVGSHSADPVHVQNVSVGSMWNTVGGLYSQFISIIVTHLE